MGLPISSRLVAADWVRQASPRSSARWANRYWAMGERQMLPWHTNSIFIISLISLQKPSNLDITGFPALFSIFVFCLKFTLFFVNLRKFTGKWCSNWCSNLVHFQPDFLCFSGMTVPLKSIIFAICSAARS